MDELPAILASVGEATTALSCCAPYLSAAHRTRRHCLPPCHCPCLLQLGVGSSNCTYFKLIDTTAWRGTNLVGTSVPPPGPPALVPERGLSNPDPAMSQLAAGWGMHIVHTPAELLGTLAQLASEGMVSQGGVRRSGGGRAAACRPVWTRVAHTSEEAL